MPKKLAKLDVVESATCADTTCDFFKFIQNQLFWQQYCSLILPLIAIVSFNHDKDLVRKQWSNLHLFILNEIMKKK